MKECIILLAFFLFASPLQCRGGDLQRLEQKIFAIDKNLNSGELLVAIGVLEGWSKKAEEGILIDSDGSLGEVNATYKAGIYNDITDITLTWKISENEKGHVIQIEFSDKAYSYIYAWSGKKYVQVATREM